MARNNALQNAIDSGFIVIKEYGDEESTYAGIGCVKMLKPLKGDTCLVLVKASCEPGDWIDRFGFMDIDSARDAFNECVMNKDLIYARTYSGNHNCTVWAASNGREIIWSDSRPQVEREGFWICQIFEDGHIAEA